jgi:hypothetical protein
MIGKQKQVVPFLKLVLKNAGRRSRIEGKQ